MTEAAGGGTTVGEPDTADLADQLRAVMAIDPSAPFLQFEGRWSTWGDLAASVDSVDALLSGAGLGAAAPIGIVLRNRPETHAAQIAVLATRRAVVTLNPAQPDNVLAADIERQRLPAVIACGSDWAREPLVDAARASGAMAIQMAAPPADPATTLAGLDRPGDGEHHEPLPGVAIEMLTSGTTGPAKRVPLLYRRIEAAIAATAHYQQNAGALTLKRGVGILWSPLVHISGLWAAITSAGDGRKIALLERFKVDAWVELVREHRPRIVGLPPAAVRMVLDAKVPADVLESVKAVRVGTAPLSPELADEFYGVYGIPLLVVYGATEFAGAVAGWTLPDFQEFGTSKRGSVGRAHPGIELRILDREDEHVLGPGEVGVLEVKGGQVGEHWVRTTDLGRIDADGFLWVVGRADDVIIRGGYKVSTTLVAECLRSHPAVKDAGVIGIADARLGQVPVAAVELVENPGGDDTSEAGLQAWLRERLTPYQVPVQIKVVEALPRTDSMKVSQPRVRELFEEPSPAGRS
jgi:acyl-coenzyme A synthetase/AMP-(fatty) acid ligase